MRLIDADALKEDFKARLEKAKNWKENALNNSGDELVIRATATIDFICEVIMTINNAPTVEERPQGEITEEDIQNAIKAGYENGYSMAQAKYQRPHGECENCDYYKFSNAVCSGIVDEMVKLGIDNVDDLLKFLRGKEE